MNNLFSMNGRLNRKGYFLTLIIGLAIYVLSLMLVGFLLGFFRPELFVTTQGETLIDIISVLAYIPYLILMGTATVKRLHDMNRPGSHFYLLFIPIYNFFFQFLLLFEPGTAGENQYDLHTDYNSTESLAESVASI